MSGSDCRFHIAVTPYHPSLVPEGLEAIESFDPSMLERRQWPRHGHHKRQPEGGCGGEVVSDQIVVSWLDDRLLCPLSRSAEPLAARTAADEIAYFASFLVQLDGQVVYSPAADVGAYIMLVESPLAEQQAVRFDGNQTAVVDPLVKHSMPIPVAHHGDGTYEFTVWHRAVNAVLQTEADPAGPSPVVVNLHKVDRTREVLVRRVDPLATMGRTTHHAKIHPLPSSFAKQLRPLEAATREALAAYGQLIRNAGSHAECVTNVPWPGTPNNGNGCFAGQLEQDFVVTWHLDDDGMELEFEGVSGSFAGSKGRPGVEFSPELGVYTANLLMARPDGTYYVRATEPDDAFALVVALPAHGDGGDPVEDKLRVFAFSNGSAARLNPHVWHSVPIPLVGKQSTLFREIVAATNANVVINVRAESGHPIRFAQEV